MQSTLANPEVLCLVLVRLEITVRKSYYTVYIL